MIFQVKVDIGRFKNKPGQITHLMPIERTRERKIFETRPIFRASKFYLAKKKSLDLQIYCRIGQAMKKL